MSTSCPSIKVADENSDVTTIECTKRYDHLNQTHEGPGEPGDETNHLWEDSGHVYFNPALLTGGQNGKARR